MYCLEADPRVVQQVRLDAFFPARPRLNCFLDRADNIQQGPNMAVAHIFIYLQLLDLLTTLVGFRLGANEASPFIRLLMHAGPAAGVMASKLLSLALGAVCLYFKKHHLLRLISYWYGCLIVWNLMVLLTTPVHLMP